VRRVVVVMAVCYPLLVHAAVVTCSPMLTALSLGWLLALMLLPALARRNLLAWVAACIAAAALAWLSHQPWLWLPLYAPSVLADLFAAWLFGHTLAAGRVPLIERLVRLLHPPEEQLLPGVPEYAHRLTLAWSVLFVALALISLLLACVAQPSGVLLLLGVAPPFTVPQQWWSLFANFIEYLIAAGFFAVEYVYRRHRFPQQPYVNMVDFVRRAVAVAPEVMGEKKL